MTGITSPLFITSLFQTYRPSRDSNFFPRLRHTTRSINHSSSPRITLLDIYILWRKPRRWIPRAGKGKQRDKSGQCQYHHIAPPHSPLLLAGKEGHCTVKTEHSQLGKENVQSKTGTFVHHILTSPGPRRRLQRGP